MTRRQGFTYVARKQPCGCVVGLVSDYADKQTGQYVAEFIAEGCSIERVDMETYRTICNDPGFMNCPHTAKTFPVTQPGLFD